MYLCHVIWKAVVQPFPLIGDGIGWKVRDGSRVKLREDPWVGSGSDHHLPPNSIQVKAEGFLLYNYLVTGMDHWRFRSESGWSIDLGWIYWAVEINHIIIQEKEDSLTWSKTLTGVYNPKAGYAALAGEYIQRRSNGRRQSGSSIDYPRVSFLCSFYIVIKRMDLGMCALCKWWEESIFHLASECLYTVQVWKKLEVLSFNWA